MHGGRLSVPENRARPGGRRIELKVVVVRATVTPAQPDPVFFIAGGPGGDVTSAAPDFAKNLTPRSRDIVFMDQRGTRGSAFLYCQELGRARRCSCRASTCRPWSCAAIASHSRPI
jgi:pimeloyl-ACP methyl ester carboxylesterase